MKSDGKMSKSFFIRILPLSNPSFRFFLAILELFGFEFFIFSVRMSDYAIFYKF